MVDFSDSTFLTFERIRLDAVGIHPAENDVPPIRWSEVRRVALGYEIHPYVTVDFHFWAFQTTEPNMLYRVVTTLDDEVSAEVRARYGKADIPPIRKWPDAGRRVVTYVVWPPSDLGRSLYVYRKKHWWSWNSRIYHALP